MFGALTELRDRAASARLPLDVIGAEAARAEFSALAAQIGDHLLPRLREPTAPLLAVVGGPTGAGKSTLVNSLIGYPVSPADVLRPTTRAPVLVCSPDNAEWFRAPHILPGFTRATSPTDRPQPATLQIVEAATPTGLALLDSPDIDSVVAANRQLAAQLLGAADLWILVTTAARYADAIPWNLLTVARNRGTALAVLLNRVPALAAADVSGHLASLLDRNGLGDAPVFVAHECPLEPGGLLPAEFADPVRAWLFALAADDEQRLSVVWRTVDGALDSLRVRLSELAGAAEAQVAGLAALRAQVDDGLRAALRRFREAVGDGSLISGDVLTRWNAFAGTDEFGTSAAATAGRIRHRFGAALLNHQPPGTDLRRALAAALAALIRSVADSAAERIVDGWRGHPAGSSLLRELGMTVGRANADLMDRVSVEVAAWQENVIDLVKASSSGRRWRPQFATFGPGGVAMLTFIAAVTHISALADGSSGNGVAAVSRRLLRAAVGDVTAHELTDRVRRDLAARIEPLLVAETARFTGLLDSVRVDPTLAAWLQCQQAAIDKARSASR